MDTLKFLTAEEKASYDNNGFIKLSGIFTDTELKTISNEYNDLFERKNADDQGGLEAAWVGERMKREAGYIDYTVKAVHNLQMHSAVFTKVITHSKLLDAVEDVMGTENILLHHTKAHIKPPENGAPYLMHQDYSYFPFKNHTMLAVFLHLDDTTPENGGLAVYPGSHKLGPLEDKGLTDKNGEQYHYVDQDKFPLSGATPVSAKKGEIIIFSYLLLHGSYLNRSNRPRRMFLIQLRAAEDEPTELCHQSPAQNLVLRGKNKYRAASMATRFNP
ncbi:probable alpha-ketoglutarate-dependent hypophosphite dioxygenase [Athalia rosae]|uniref:probable alpha-ketoglutarate-dependent hypophosphite dioxygenase n=1 Tax=Athalia rosae TaxID=37344 RepID=UPI00203385D5|nr:probable alpha-ketoglutarate-dependent hypophosphite dioxygenase [Athalia rosae]